MRYRFGQFELDSVRYELTRAGERIDVQPRVFDVLRYLLERPETLVTRQELLQGVWVGQHVTESTMLWAIGHARRAIGQRSGQRGPIETVHARGYRFRGPVEVSGASAHKAPPFVGRGPLIAALCERLEQTEAGHGGCVILIGDAGIGKTRCLDELSAHACAKGFSVWNGRALPDRMAPVYTPWIQALRAAQTDASAGADAAGVLTHLCNHADGGLPIERTAVHARLAVFEEVTRFLTDSGRRNASLLVLDDFHWADAGSIALLGYVAAELRRSRVLVVVSTRTPLTLQNTPDGSEPLTSAELITLTPLSLEDVSAYVHGCLSTANEALCEGLWRASAGYPLFLQESLARLIAQHGRAGIEQLRAADVVPGRQTHELLGMRVAGWTPAERFVLGCASVLGEAFELVDLIELAKQSPQAVLKALGSALRSGFVVHTRGDHYRFRHALFREAVYDQMELSERLSCHRDAAHMRELRPDRVERASEIAQHYHRSQSLGAPERVRAAAVEAARAASAACSHTDAAEFYGWALDAIAHDPSANEREYAELLLATAHSQRCAGNPEGSRVHLTRCVQLAMRHGYGDLLVRAARALRLSQAAAFIPDPLARSALERVTELYASDTSELKVQALSLLSWLPPTAFDMERSKHLSQEALRQAKHIGARETLAEALTARLYALSGPDDIDAQLSVIEEMVALDGESGSWITMEAYVARHDALLQRGDLSAAARADEAMRALADARGFLEARWNCDRHKAQRQILSGDFAGGLSELARLQSEASRIGLQRGARVIQGVRAAVSFTTVGTAGEFCALDLEVIKATLSSLAAYANISAGAARRELGRGQTDSARQVLDAVSVDEFRQVPKNFGYVNTLCNVSLVAVALGDRPRAEQLYDLLSPYAHFQTPNIIRLCEGPVAHYLGELASFLRRDAIAERHFAHAISLCEEQKTLPQLAHTLVSFAQHLARSSRPKRVRELCKRAQGLSTQLNMPVLTDKIRQLEGLRSPP